MTPDQYCKALAKVGLTQEAAGIWFGRSERTGQRWAVGDYAVPNYVAKFLRLMIKLNIRPEDVK